MGVSRRGLFTGIACAGLRGRQAAALGCDDIAEPPPVALSDAERERHGIFVLLAMALVFDAWGVDRARPELLAEYAAAEPGRVFADYAGHNVGAVLVDRGSRVVCAGLNRNVLLNNTMAHAEVRTVSRAIDLANAAGRPRWSFGGLLEGDVLYTTLEPCSQCAGVMELANLAAVVYGQDDPAQQSIATVIYNLRHGAGDRAVLPIRAEFTPFWAPLAAAYRRFEATTAGPRTGLTSFLQTVDAYTIFRDAASAFVELEPVHPDNREILKAARAFRADKPPLRAFP